MSQAPRWLFLALLSWWTMGFVTHPLNGDYAGGSFLHLINLPFHEAGHIIFSPLGSFMMSLGGSLMQVLIPLVCTVEFLRREDRFGAMVGIWWAGQNLIDLGPYIADARALQLVLLGGFTGAQVEGHDWEAILTALGWLRYDRTLGLAAHGIGSLAMIGAIGYAAWITIQMMQVSSNPHSFPTHARMRVSTRGSDGQAEEGEPVEG
jgi:hypothetical protein